MPGGVKIETQRQYLDYLGSRIRVLVDELAQDPEEYTGYKDVRRALESIVKKYIEDKIPYPTEISVHPTTWVETIMYYLEDSMQYFTLSGRSNRGERLREGAQNRKAGQKGTGDVLNVTIWQKFCWN